MNDPWDGLLAGDMQSKMIYRTGKPTPFDRIHEMQKRGGGGGEEIERELIFPGWRRQWVALYCTRVRCAASHCSAPAGSEGRPAAASYPEICEIFSCSVCWPGQRPERDYLPRRRPSGGGSGRAICARPGGSLCAAPPTDPPCPLSGLNTDLVAERDWFSSRGGVAPSPMESQSQDAGEDIKELCTHRGGPHEPWPLCVNEIILQGWTEVQIIRSIMVAFYRW